MEDLNHRKLILTYPIASGDMHYAVQNERAVYLDGDPETGFSLYGQIPDGGDLSSVNLAEVLLEFAMAWSVPGDASEARRQMHVFGRRLGEALVAQRVRTKPANGVLERAADVLEDIFRSVGASFINCQTQSEVRYQLDRNPLQVIARFVATEREVELAHHALNAIFQSVVSALDPELHIQLPSGPHVEQVIRVLAPTRNRQLGTGNLAVHQTLTPIKINSKS